MNKHKTNNKINKKTDIDSSDISSYNEDEDYENMTQDQISQKGKEKFFKTELMEKIVKYIKIDDSIKEKQKETAAVQSSNRSSSLSVCWVAKTSSISFRSPRSSASRGRIQIGRAHV